MNQPISAGNPDIQARWSGAKTMVVVDIDGACAHELAMVLACRRALPPFGLLIAAPGDLVE
jgi:hypothetical protein